MIGLYIAIAALWIWFVILAPWVCGANDGTKPSLAGRSRGARLIQLSPVYKLAYWLYETPA